MSMKIRISSLPGYQTCMRRQVSLSMRPMLDKMGFKFAKRKRHIAGILGSGTHSGTYKLASIYMRKRSIDEESIEAAVHAGIKEYKERLNGDESDMEIIYDVSAPNHDACYYHIKRFVERYSKDVLPSLEFGPKDTPEKCLEVEVKGNMMGCQLTGHIDVIPTRGIRDTKNGANFSCYHTQLGGYGLLLGKDNFDTLHVDYLPRVPIGQAYPGTKIIPYDKQFCLTEAYVTLKNVIETVKLFEEKQNPSCIPASPGCRLCGPKYCPSFKTKFCQYIK